MKPVNPFGTGEKQKLQLDARISIPISAAASSLHVLLSCYYHTTFQSLCKVG